MRILIRGAQVIAFRDGEHRLLDGGDISIENDLIRFVGSEASGDFDRIIDARRHLVFPGFISLHTHPVNSALARSYLEDLGSKQFGMSTLYEYLPLSSTIRSENAEAGLRFSYVELLKSGVTTAVDLLDPVPRRSSELAREVGVRAYIAPPIQDGRWYTPDGNRVLYEWDHERGQAALERAVDFAAELAENPNDLVQPMLAPSQVDTCTPELLRAVRERGRELGLRVQVHASQSTVEFREMLQRHGQTPIEFLRANDMLGPDVIVGHGIFVSGHPWLQYPGRDLELLAETGTHVAHCPWVFARRGMAMHSLHRYRQAGINIGMGLDSFPLDMFNEMRAGALTCKLLEGNAGVATARQMFDAATLGGAAALGRSDLGRIAPGAKADLVFVRLDRMSMTPYRDPLKNLVWSGSPADIDMVMVDGQVVVSEGNVLAFNTQDLAHEVQQAAERLWQELPERDWAGRNVDELSPPSLKSWD
jgi:5-methylthioadenosine/S-adenosylhomocysteine deaminase